MTAGSGDLVVQTSRHQRGWVLVPFRFPIDPSAFLDLNLLLNTGRPQTCLGHVARDVLGALGFAVPLTPTSFSVRNAYLGFVALPDMTMRLSAGPALLGLEGMLGLDFLERFAEVRFDTRALRLTLVRR